jgi:biotin carboxylase
MSRILLLMTTHTYRAQPFVEAARRLNVEIVKGINLPNVLADQWRAALPIDFGDPDEAIRTIVDFAAQHPIDAILSVDDSASIVAAHASKALGLPHNAPDAAEAARNKYLMRTLLKRGGVQVPNFRLCSTAEDAHDLAQQVPFPCVVKPLMLNGSRGVMRADDVDQFVAAVDRLSRLLQSIEPTFDPKPFLAEDFIPGFEVALEGLLDHGRLKVLALFDKPDPLDGPFFEETIYVTPSRLPNDVQSSIEQCASDAARALGLYEGPMHAELRVNDRGAWLVEVAGRSIGGLCSQTLRFAHSADVTLEEMIMRQALGLEIESIGREAQAGGVMMIPIPGAGLLRSVSSLEDAKAVTGIEDIEITAKLNYPLVPLPEGESYLGFIFARGDSSQCVEAALREAHAKLHFDVQPLIPLLTNTRP